MDTTEQLLKQQGFPIPSNFVIAGLSKVSHCIDESDVETFYIYFYSVDGQVSL